MTLSIQNQDIIPALMAGMIDGVLVVDRSGIIVMANRAAENLFLIRTKAMVGKTLTDIDDNVKIDEMIHKVLSTGNEVFTETTVNPGTKIFRVHVVAIKEGAESIGGAIVVFHDVTDARNFDQVRSEFVGNVSHELRTPLTSIKGFVETLLDGALEDKILCRRFLSIIDTETERLGCLIDDLLTLSALESKECMIQPKPVCIVRAVRTVMNIFGPQISEKQLHVEFIYPSQGFLIFADENMLNQVLINLLDNAIKYTQESGKIIIRCQREDTRIVTTFTDNGVGIPRESLSRVFERFYRVDKARSRDQGGTGLGLAIVKHIVESLGGDVFVDSEVGKGSTFGVSFLAV